MKKEYISPVLNMVLVQTQHMMAGSLESMSDEGGSVNVSSTPLGEGVESESRGSSIWDED